LTSNYDDVQQSIPNALWGERIKNEDSLHFSVSIKGITKAMYLFNLISVAKFYSKKYLDLKDTKEKKNLTMLFSTKNMTKY
jgi:hypothetical protein